MEGIFCRDFKESETVLSLCLSLQKPTRREIPVDIEPVSEIVTELELKNLMKFPLLLSVL